MLVPCSVHVTPPDAGVAWIAAVGETTDRIRSMPAGETDCRELIIEVGAGGAVVTLRTTDGRSASRAVSAAAEVLPVVRALLVTTPRPGDMQAEPTALPPSAPEEESKDAPSKTSRNASSKPRILFALGGGSHFGFSGSGFGESPAAMLALGALAGSFELGAFGSRDFAYAQISGTGASMVATTGGLFAGVRRSFGGFALAGGLDANVSLVEATWSNAGQQQGMNQGPNSESPITAWPTEVGFGGYVAVLLPVVSRLRVRAQLGVDKAAVRYGVTAPLPAPLPDWRSTIAFSLEGSAP